MVKRSSYSSLKNTYNHNYSENFTMQQLIYAISWNQDIQSFTHLYKKK